MLERLKGRAAKAGVLDSIGVRLASPDSMGTDLRSSIDFTLAFAVVHEFLDAARLFAEAPAASKPAAALLLAEPKGHVNAAEFDSELQAASQAGLNLVDRPSIRRSQAALLKKTEAGSVHSALAVLLRRQRLTLPIENHHLAEVQFSHARVDLRQIAYEQQGAALQTSDLPKLSFCAHPRALTPEPVVAWARANLSNLQTADIGAESTICKRTTQGKSVRQLRPD